VTVGATSENDLRSSLAQIRDSSADLICQRFPRIPRRVSGYSLDELLPESGFNVARALVGTWRWNMACDHAINPILVDAGLTLPQGVLLDNRFRG
jgi:hypothetical protein